MKLRLVRAVLFLYPSSWRRRYGVEIEQWVRDSAAERSSGLDSARLVVGLAGSGIAQRFSRYGTGARIAVVVSLAAAAAICVDATTLGGSALGQGRPVPMSGTAPSSNALLAGNVTIVHSFTDGESSRFTLQPHRIVVHMLPGGLRVTGISGADASTVRNPDTGRILSVRSGG